MSGKPTAAKCVIDEKIKEIAGESKECCSKKKKKQTLNKKLIEHTKKTMEEIIETHETEALQKFKDSITLSNKPEDPKTTEICQMSTTMSEMFISNKPDDPKTMEICQTSEKSTSIQLENSEAVEMSKTTSEMSTSNKPEDQVPEIYQMPKNTFEIPVSSKLEILKALTLSKVYPRSETTSETSTSNISEDYKDSETCQMKQSKTAFDKFISAEFEAVETSKVAEVCQMDKTTSEMSTFTETLEVPKAAEVCQMDKTTSEMSTFTDAPEIPKTAGVCQMNKTTSEMSTFTEAPEVPKAAEVCQMDKTTSEMSTFTDAPEIPKTAEVCQMPKTTSEMSTATELDAPKFPKLLEMCQMFQTKFAKPTSTESEILETLELPKVCPMSTTAFEKYVADELEALENPKVARMCRMPKTACKMSTATELNAPEFPKHSEMCQILETTSEISTSIETEEPEVPEVRRTRSMSKISNKTVEPEIPEVRRTRSTVSKMIATFMKSDNETNFTKDIKNEDSEVPIKKLEQCPVEDTNSTDDTDKIKMMPIIEKDESARYKGTRRVWPPMSMPDFEKSPLVLATHHMVPSLPIELFEMFAEMIEVVTKRPVVMLHECRNRRPIATEVADIVIMPATETWKEGVLLPASFVFEHYLNKDKLPSVYVDVIVANDRAPHIKDIMDLRGHRCAIPDKRDQFSAGGLLFNHLHSKGENSMFFGNILVARMQLEVLEMVASKQVEVGILESPVIRCHKYRLPGVDSLHILTSLGPLPPYRIMIKNTLANKMVEKLTTYLLDINKNKEWMERLLPFGVIGFAENSMDYYKLANKKRIATNVPYY